MAIKNQQPFFAHDANSRNNDKMIRLRMKHGVAGYGVYYMLLERLRCADSFKSELDYEVLAYDLDCDKELIRSVIEDFGLFEVLEDGAMFHSIELTEKMEAMMEAKRKRQELARRAAEARWGKLAGGSVDAPFETLEHPESDVISRRAGGRLREELNRMKTDIAWCDAIKAEFGLSAQSLSDYFEAFYANCVCNGQTEHRNFSDTVKHCRSYIRKMTSTKAEKGSAPIADTLSKKETQRLKEFNARHDQKNSSDEAPKKAQSGDNVFRNMGYEPTDCTMANLFNADWRQLNPPTHPEWIGRFTGRETVAEVELQLNSEMVTV